MIAKKDLCLIVVFASALFLQSPAQGQSVLLDKDEQRVFEEFSWLPYAFFSESFGLGFGAGGAYSGWPQEQASVLGAATLGTKGSYNFMGMLSDYQVPRWPRLVVEPFFMLGRYQEQRLYVGRNPEFGGERAGSNDSDADHYVEATQWDNQVALDFRFLLPLGHGRDTIISRYVMDKGLLLQGASGGDTWNPLTSGRTTLSLKPEWREQTLENDDLKVPLTTWNVGLALEYDNHDFPYNPTRGSSQCIAYKRDFDDHDNLGEWESWTVEANKVFNLGASDRFDQRILAVGFWTAYIPTWETEEQDGVTVVTRRPPQFESASLGGLYRLRGYEDDRFHDKAAIYYTTELRMIPTWQPLNTISWLKWAHLKWWQWVLFAEAGQVAPSYNLETLHEDLHFDGGFSFRAMIHKAVGRLDFTASEEGGRVTAMYGHPF